MERRRISRAHIDSLIYLALEPNNGGILLDLSHRGMRISVAHPLHAGTQMKFSFGASPVHQVQGIGRIAWIDRSKKSAGICFVHLSEESTGTIKELLTPAPQKAAEDPSSQAQDSAPSPDLQSALSLNVTTGLPGTRTPTFESLRSMAAATCVPVDPCNSPKDAGVDADNIPESTLAHDVLPPEASHSPEARHAVTDSTYPLDHGSDLLRMEQDEPDPDPEPISNEADPLARSLSSDGDNTSRNDELAAQQPDLPIDSTPEPPVAIGAPAQQTHGANDPLPVFTLSPTYPSPPSQLTVIGKAILPALDELGWGVENDWHMVAGLGLIIAGFIALWQSSPLRLLAVPLWIAGAWVLTGKRRSRHRADP